MMSYVCDLGIYFALKEYQTLSTNCFCTYFSPSKSVEKSLIAVGLLDATIKIFFNNTMKFFLSL